MRSTAIGLSFAGTPFARRLANRLVVLAVAGCMVALFSACGSTSGSISVEMFPLEPPPPNEYIIGIGDMLDIQVYDQGQFSGRVRVRTDGKIPITLAGEVVAAGKTPVALQGEIENNLKAVVLVPRVTVIVVESNPLSISIRGEVGRPGLQSVPRGPSGVGVADALAAAGGLTPFAHKDRIYVDRPGEPQRIRFSYQELLRGVGRGASFRLRLGDVIVVE